jgi:general secretion pathway protein J
VKQVWRSRRRIGAQGFTLIEVLVALLIMAILATLSWQGLDGIVRTRERSRDAIDATVRLTTVMTQWEQDLQAVVDTGALASPLTFDGMTLRLTRRTDGGVMLVAWAVRNGLWQRWTSPVMTRVVEVQENWARSQALQGGEPAQLTVAGDASQWQIYFNRGGQWTNAQSTGDLAVVGSALPLPEPSAPASAASGAAAAGAAGAASGAAAAGAAGTTGVQPPPGAPGAPPVARELLPEAVRLQITLGGKLLTRDIAVGAGA